VHEYFCPCSFQYYYARSSVVPVVNTGTKIIPEWALLILVPVLELELELEL